MKYDTALVMPMLPPQGRLTLTTNVPVLIATVATSANVLYTPYVGNLVPIWDGIQFKPQIFAELTNVLANSATGSAGPAAGAASKNYDLFVWNNAGVITLTRGGAWNSDTVRSATTENDLQRVNGVLCNLNTITNGPAAGYGTYVGTVRTDAGGATVSWSVGGTAAGGTPATLNLWNMYNRVDVRPVVIDSNVSWNYTTATVRALDNSNGNRISFIRGLAEDSIEAMLMTRIQTAAGVNSFGFIGIALNATNAFTQQQALVINILAAGDTGVSIAAKFIGSNPAVVAIGFNFLQATEQGDGANVSTIYGTPYMSFSGAFKQ